MTNNTIIYANNSTRTGRSLDNDTVGASTPSYADTTVSTPPAAVAGDVVAGGLVDETTIVRREELELRAGDADLQVEGTAEGVSANEEEFDEKSLHLSSTRGSTGAGSCPFKDYVPLRMGGNGRTHMVSEGSRSLIFGRANGEEQEEISVDDLRKMTWLFYQKAFKDETLEKFILDREDPHANRFALWIYQKFTGRGIWDEERSKRGLKPVTLANGALHVVHDRSSSHVAAWFCRRRPSAEVGRHFQLDECRVWMRLHFWALRESGLLESHPSFADYYVRFIAHFVRVYEGTAPMFARESLRWSADASNVDMYLNKNNRSMKDVLGLSLEEAQQQLPRDELNDWQWPYNQNADGAVVL